MTLSTVGGNYERMVFDLFERWPVQADWVILARVLHDWPDKQCLSILERAHEALKPGGKVVILEIVRQDNGMGGALGDIHLLVTTNGKERKWMEWKRLISQAGFSSLDLYDGPDIIDMITAGK